MNKLRGKATVRDVAKKAGVSLATVDRVLNARSGVRQKTREKVERAVAALNYSRDLGASLLARGTYINVHFILPGNDNPFMEMLAQAINRLAGDPVQNRTRIEMTRVAALNAGELARVLDGLDPADCSCAVIVSTDEPVVIEAVARASDRGIVVLTLVSDLPDSRRQRFIGIDNTAAGRTAASLMGRFCHERGRIGLIIGSMNLRDQRQRFVGFHNTLLEEYRHLEIVGPVEGFDDAGETGKRVHELFEEYPDLDGLYSMGAGNRGLVNALKSLGKTRRIVTIVHELSDTTARELRSGLVDVVLDQNPKKEIALAIELAQKLVSGIPVADVTEPVDIGIFLRDNLPLPFRDV